MVGAAQALARAGRQRAPVPYSRSRRSSCIGRQWMSWPGWPGSGSALPRPGSGPCAFRAPREQGVSVGELPPPAPAEACGWRRDVDLRNARVGAEARAGCGGEGAAAAEVLGRGQTGQGQRFAGASGSMCSAGLLVTHCQPRQSTNSRAILTSIEWRRGPACGGQNSASRLALCDTPWRHKVSHRWTAGGSTRWRCR